MHLRIYIFLKKLYLFSLRALSDLYQMYYALKGVVIGKGVLFKGKPVIKKYPGSTIVIGDDCVVSSSLNANGIGNNHPVILRTISSTATIKLGNKVGISGTTVLCKNEIIIEDNTLIGANVFITDSDHHPIHPVMRLKNDASNIKSFKVHIEENVFIGAYAIILKGVKIGKNSVVGAGSVVTKNIPQNSIAAGNPAKIIKSDILQEDTC